MNATTLRSTRFQSLISKSNRSLAFVVFGLMAAAAVALAIALAIASVRNAAIATPLPPAATPKQIALVAATSGEASIEMRAVGSQAEVINAALPFAKGPVTSARPFEASGSQVDEQRALLCLTQAVYYEAGYEPLAGRRAVAQVVLNRMRHPAFPKSICGVVYQHSASGICQFSFICDGSLNRAPAADAWRQARDIASAALAGYVEKSVGSATHYHADYVAPRWAPMLAKISQIGQHIFYRWPGGWGAPSAFTGRYIGEPSEPSALRPRFVAAISQYAGNAGRAADNPLAAGPPVPRAENDVGGLLDTSKGWTLTLPDINSPESSAAKLIAQQEGAKPSTKAPVKVASVAPLAGGPQPGSRGER